jgi:peptidoglycan-N-acetylglucosamine deacetylase
VLEPTPEFTDSYRGRRFEQVVVFSFPPEAPANIDGSSRSSVSFSAQMHRNLHRLRQLLPLQLRCALQERSPNRTRRWRELPGVERVPAGRRAVLTFDDGPDPADSATPAVLDALDATGARATFFAVGEQIASAPDLIGEIVARGHEVGVHGQRHFRHDRVAATESSADIESGYAAVAEAIGERPRFYRPPYGKLTPDGAATCQRLGLEVAYWSTWGLDWEPISSARIASRVNRDLDDGAIVLLHDSARYAARASAAETANAVEAIATHAAELDLDLVALGEALVLSEA